MDHLRDARRSWGDRAQNTLVTGAIREGDRLLALPPAAAGREAIFAKSFVDARLET
jgi:hypothetical protein